MIYSPTILSIIFSSAIISIFVLSSFTLKKYVHQSERLNHTIEGLRGLACILVFVNHSAWMFTNNGIDSGLIDYDNFKYFGNFGAFGVELFFCITGYLFASKIKMGDFNLDFYGKRIRRLAPAYLLVAFVTFILFFIKYNYLINTLDDLSKVVQQIFGFGFFGSGVRVGGQVVTSLNVVVWTLPFEWKFYAMIPFIAYCFKNKALMIPLFIFSLSVVYSQYIEDNVLWLYFITGFVCSYIKKTTSKSLNCFLSILSLLLLIYIVLSTYYQYSAMRVIPISAFFIVCMISNPSWIRAVPISIAGTLSYSIYLTHQAVMFSVVNIFSAISDKEMMTTYALLTTALVSVVITMIVSMLLYKKVEKKFI